MRLLLAFVSCLEDNLNHLSTLHIPFLILHGNNDSLCNVSGSRLLYEQAASEDKEIHEFPGMKKDALKI